MLKVAIIGRYGTQARVEDILEYHTKTEAVGFINTFNRQSKELIPEKKLNAQPYNFIQTSEVNLEEV